MEAAKKASEVAPLLATATKEQKNAALAAVKAHLLRSREKFEAAVQQDMDAAAVEVKAGKMKASMFKRLDCRGEKFDSTLSGIDDVIALDDPVGKCKFARQLADGLNLYRISAPIGVLLIIFEARPDACIQIMSLAIKSGNAVILKGGKEATHAVKAIQEIANEALADAPGVPAGSVQVISTHEDIATLLKLDEYVDLVIPRGSNHMVRYIKDNSTIPVLGHADGICALYVDAECDTDLALRVIEDSKLNYVAACNAMETLLVNEAVAKDLLPALGARLKGRGMHYYADAKAIEYLPKEETEAATEASFKTEYLREACAVKVVPDVQTAIDHINAHGSGHTDCIVTTNSATADRFLRGVDSAGVYCNVSTRFADGFRYGFGAEVGISTNKIHARGPVGLEGLVTYRYRLYGAGQCVGELGKKGAAGAFDFAHKDLALETVADSDRIAAIEKGRFAI